MGPVHFTDGFDRPDTIAFGLDAPRLITVVVGALSAYAVMQAPLPFALRVAVAVVLAVCSAVLGWARVAGRPVLWWAWLGLRFALSPRSGGGGPVARAEVAESAPPQLSGAPVDASAPARLTDATCAEDAVAEPAAPVEDGLPVWAQWLHFEAQGDTTDAPEALAPDVVEPSRPAPLVVVMDEPGRGDGDVVGAGDEAPIAALAASPQDAAAPPQLGDAVELDVAEDDADEQPAAAEVLHLPLMRRELTPPPPLHTASTVAPNVAPPPVFVGAPRRITFFSLNGGSGRTTLATELACLLAARGRHLAADGTVRPLDVALLDLDLRSATVSVRLGIPQPTLADYVARGADTAQLDACMVRHPSGVRALLGMPKPVTSGAGALEAAHVAEMMHALERGGAQFVVVDVAADHGAVTTWVLSAVHDIFVVLTPTASGVQDAYRTTAALRRLGLAHKLRYVVNRARGSVDLDEVMGDLGGRIAAVIPYDPAVEDAENQHRIVGLDGSGPAAAALHDLAALLYPSLSSATRRARGSWLPWRRRAG